MDNNYRERAKELLRQQIQTIIDNKQVELDNLIIEYEKQNLLKSLKRRLDLNGANLDLSVVGYKETIDDYSSKREALESDILKYDYFLNEYLR